MTLLAMADAARRGGDALLSRLLSAHAAARGVDEDARIFTEVIGSRLTMAAIACACGRFGARWETGHWVVACRGERFPGGDA